MRYPDHLQIVDPKDRRLPTVTQKIKVTEIFHSIQGESSLVGERTSFIRVTGCPLRCSYCDTRYAYGGGHYMTFEQILEEVTEHKTKYVCLTGGEPLAHPSSLPLVLALRANGYKISIETGGEEDVRPFVGLAKLVMDIKTPGSYVYANQAFENLQYLLPTDEVKFVICNKEDYLWSKEILRKYSLVSKFTVLFSPSYDQVSLKDLAEWILEEKLDVRLQTQLHKHIWGPNVPSV
ncbi:MAG: radical SAM protein [Bacteriovoracia bacterium]